MDIRAAFQIALKYYQSGNLGQAALQCETILEKNPKEISALHFLGIIYQQLKNYDAAIKYLMIALQLDPNSPEGIYNLGSAFEKKGALDEAINCYQKVILLHPSFVDAYLRLGNIFLAEGRFDKAISCYQKTIELNPSNIGTYYNLGVAFQKKEEFDKAISCYQKVIHYNPKFVDAYINLGISLKKTGKINDAIVYYQKALDLNPTNYLIHTLLGDVFHLKGQLDETLQYFQKAKDLNPTCIDTYSNLGNALAEKGQFDEAIKCFQESLQLNPNYDLAYYSIGNTLYKQGKMNEAIASYDRALNINPKNYVPRFARCFSQLPMIYIDELSIHTSRSNYYKELLNVYEMISLENPSDIKKAAAAEAVGVKQPFYLAYQGLNDKDLQQLYGKCLNKIMLHQYPHFMEYLPMPSYSLGEKIRLGFVSKFFYRHSVWKIPLKGWVENLDNRRFSLYGYCTGTKKDKETERAKNNFIRFVEDIHSFEELCNIIRADNLHVLIYPEIGMDPMSIKLASLRLAPIQCTSWGHPDTSGLSTIDYFISGDLIEPVNGDDHYTEQLIRLPNLSIYYIPPDMPIVDMSRDAFNFRQNSTLYHCCQSLFKYLPQYDEIFPKIAQQVKECQFIFSSHKESNWLTDQFQLRIKKAFDRFNLDVEKYAIFLPYLDTKQYFAIYNLSDVFLDPIGWSGCNSALEAITLNLPIVTFPSKLMRGRETAAILTMMNLKDTIAHSLDEYVNIAAMLGNNSELRKKISGKIAKNKHLVYKDKACITGLEEFFVKAVKEKSNRVIKYR